MIEWRTVSIDYPQLRGAQNIEEVLCLAVLVANKVPNINTTKDAFEYWQTLDYGYGCSDCQFIQQCLACIINE